MAAEYTNSASGQSDRSITDLPTPELRIFKAWSLASNGAFDDAENLLCKDGTLPASINELDLLARIAAHKRQFQRARQLWESILQKDPNHIAAKAALERLRKPWFAIAVTKRIVLLVGIAVVVFISAVGTFTLFTVAKNNGLTQYKSSIPTAQKSKIARPEASLQLPTAELVTKTEQSSNTVSYIDFSESLSKVSGCSVYTNHKEICVVFNEGLFRSLCELEETAYAHFGDLAKVLKENVQNCWFIIEGHTNSWPVPPNSVFKDNYSLGLHRAIAVAEIFTSLHQVPANSFFITSTGVMDPPFSGDDYRAMRKNMTVVIRIIPKDF